MAKISELSNAVLEQQILAFKKKVVAGDESQKKFLVALVEEKKKRIAALKAKQQAQAQAKAKAQAQAKAKAQAQAKQKVKEPEPEEVEEEEVEEEAPAPKAKKGKLGGGKKKIGGAKKGKLGGSKKAAPAKGKAKAGKSAKASKPEKKERSSKSARNKKVKKSAPKGDKTAIGKIRNPILVFLFTMLSLGIYGLIYQFKVFNEMKRYRGRGIGGAVSLLLLFIPWIIIIGGGALFAIQQDLLLDYWEQMQLVLTIVPAVSLLGPLVVLFALPLHITSLYKEDEEEEGGVSIIIPFLLIIPVIGPFLYTYICQGALNRFWEAKGPDEEEDEEDEDEEDDEDEEEEDEDDDDDEEYEDDDDDDFEVLDDDEDD